METRIYKSIDGCDIAADIYHASESRGQNLPAILFIHGGGLVMGHRKMIMPNQIAAFHNGGFHVVSIDYRLASEARLPEILEDIVDAWEWLRSEADGLGIDRERIAVVGHSAGGFLTLTSGFRLDPRPAALVSMAGYGKLTHDAFTGSTDFYVTAHEMADEGAARATIGRNPISASTRADSMQRYTGRGLFYLYCRQQGIWLDEISGHDSADSGWLAQYEPIENVTADYPPTMLLHGEPDTDIPFEQSVLMQAELERHDVAHEFIQNPNWPHPFPYIPGLDGVDAAFERMVAFLQQHV